MKIKLWTYANYKHSDILHDDGIWISLTPNLWKRKTDAEYAAKNWHKAADESFPGETAPTGVKQITIKIS